MDNLSNSNPESFRRVAEIIGLDEIPFYQVDIRDKADLNLYLQSIRLILVFTLQELKL